MDSRLWIDRKAALLLGCALILSCGWVAFLAPTAFAAGGSISGTVTDKGRIIGQVQSEADAPLSAILVRPLLRMGSGETATWSEAPGRFLTDDTGSYELFGLDAGVYRLAFLDEQGAFYREYYSDVETLDAATDMMVADNTTVTGIEARLAPTSGITGVVTNASGQPLADIWVGFSTFVTDDQGGYWQQQGSAATRADGKYGLFGLAPGSYRVNFYPSDNPPTYAPEYYDNVSTVEAAADVTVLKDVITPNINAQLGRTSSISGKVVNNQQTALGDVRVMALRREVDRDGNETWITVATVTTSSDGRYTITNLIPAAYRLFFTKPENPLIYRDQYYANADEASAATTIDLAADQTLTAINAQLKSASRILGKVTDNAGAPLQNIDIRLWRQTAGSGQWQELESTFTGADGIYRFGLLADGFYRLGFFPPPTFAYATEYYNDVETFAAAADLMLTPTTDQLAINAQLGPRSHITGRVTNSAGQPLSAISVQAFRWITDGAQAGTWQGATNPVTSDSNGNYVVTGLEAGLYRLHFMEDGARNLYLDEFYDNAYSVGSATTITVPRSSTVPNINITLTTGGSISGRVTGPTGQAAAGVLVSALQQQVNAGGDLVWDFVGHGSTTDSNGRYTLTHLPPGAYRVYFDDFNLGRYAAEFYNDAPAVELAADINVPTAGNVPNINAQLVRAAGISGRVIGPDGSAAAGVHIGAYQLVTDPDGDFWQAILYTDSDEQGNYLLGGLLPGSYRVAFAVTDFDLTGAYVAEVYDNVAFLADGQDLVVTAGQTRSGVNAQLERRPALGGTVTDPAGAPLADLTVSLIYSATSPNGEQYPVTVGFAGTDGAGHYHFADILVGAYTVCFSDAAQPPHWRAECYNNARTIDGATWVTLQPNADRNDINAQLASTANNAPPVAVADTISLFPGTRTTVLTSGATSLLANDFDADGDQLRAAIVENPLHGALHVAATGAFTYTHNGDAATTDRFVYQVTDEVGATATAAVTITIKPPVAIDFTKTVWLAGLGSGCQGSSNLRIPVSTTVAYCYTVYNSGIVTLTTHTLIDDQLGTLLADAPYALAPGMRYRVLSTATITAPLTNTATWTASAAAQQPLTATATATVTFSAATDDQDHDGIVDWVEGIADPDQDGVPSFLDPDADGDLVLDRAEWGNDLTTPRDSNNDGLPDYLDPNFPYNHRLQLPVIAKPS